jgi:hypothetical protein
MAPPFARLLHEAGLPSDSKRSPGSSSVRFWVTLANVKEKSEKERKSGKERKE